LERCHPEFKIGSTPCLGIPSVATPGEDMCSSGAVECRRVTSIIQPHLKKYCACDDEGCHAFCKNVVLVVVVVVVVPEYRSRGTPLCWFSTEYSWPAREICLSFLDAKEKPIAEN
jgi:hypothetical protein